MRTCTLISCFLGVVLLACVPRGDPAVGDGFSDDFARSELGPAWRTTGGTYQLIDGKLKIRGARNKPLWLRRTLPRNVRTEFDVRSESAEGDIKVEVYGDGVSKAVEASYTATSYVIIFGGWGNTKNVLARLDEHGADRVVGPPRKVERGRTYRMKIEREGDTISAWVDGQLLAKMVDKDPLWGPGHDHFAFNNWQSELWFDNLKITPL
jgi:ribosomal protein S9